MLELSRKIFLNEGKLTEDLRRCTEKGSQEIRFSLDWYYYCTELVSYLSNVNNMGDFELIPFPKESHVCAPVVILIGFQTADKVKKISSVCPGSRSIPECFQILVTNCQRQHLDPHDSQLITPSLFIR